MENTGLKNGMYRINECKHKLKRHAAIKQGFAKSPKIKIQKIPIQKIEESSLNALMALSISIKTNTVKDIVDALALPTVKYKQGLALYATPA